MLEMLKILLKERQVKLSDLQQRLHMNKKSFESLVYLSEYSEVIVVDNQIVSIPAQVYSILFEPLVIHEGTEQLIQEVLTGRTNFRQKELTIPSMLVPLLLLRSIIPYFGLVLRDAENDGELELDPEKKEFLYNFFSPFKFDYKGFIEKWSMLDFTSNEFYNLWFVLNRRLPKVIKMTSKYATPTIKKEKWIRSEKSKLERSDKKKIESVLKVKIDKKVTREIDDRFYNIPLESLRIFFKMEGFKKGRIIYNNIDYPEKNLKSLIKTNIDLEKILEYVRQIEKSRGQITLNVYKNGVLKWLYFDQKGDVPPLILTAEGIFGDNDDLKRFSKQRVKRQSEYLLNLTERISGEKKLGMFKY